MYDTSYNGNELSFWQTPNRYIEVTLFLLFILLFLFYGRTISIFLVYIPLYDGLIIA